MLLNLENKKLLVLVVVFFCGNVSGIFLTRNYHSKTLAFFTVKRLPKIERQQPPYHSNPIVFLVAGQSNAANFAAAKTSADDRAYAFSQGVFYFCSDPLPGATGKRGSPWPILAQKVLDSGVSDCVVIASVGIGSTRIQDWRPGTAAFQNMVDTAIQLDTCNLPVSDVIWFQGEEDGAEETDYSTYLSSLTGIIGEFRHVAHGSTWHIVSTSHRAGAVWLPVRNAQIQASLELEDVVIGADMDALGSSFRSDGVHLNLDGQERIATDLYHSFFRTLKRSARHVP